MMGDYQSGNSTELQVQSTFMEFHYIGLTDEIHWVGNHIAAPLSSLEVWLAQNPSLLILGLVFLVTILKLSRGPSRVTLLA